MVRRLSESEIAERLSTLPGWRFSEGALEKSWTFRTFKEAWSFVDSVASASEREEHHPDILWHYNEVTLRIWTHSEGGVTEWDLDLANAIERGRSG